MNVYNLRWIITVLACIASTFLVGQRVIYLEEFDKQRATKIYEGQQLEIKEKELSNSWQRIRIEAIFPEDGYFAADDGIHYLKDITHVRFKRRWARYLRNSLGTAGTTTAIYGALTGVRNGSMAEIIGFPVVGGIIYGVGWLIDRAFYNRVLKINKRNRLKLIDLTPTNDMPLEPRL